MVEYLAPIDPVLASLLLTAVGTVGAIFGAWYQRRSQPKKIPRYEESLETPEDATKFAKWLIKNYEKTVYINIHLNPGAGGRESRDTDENGPRFALESAVAGYFSPEIGLSTEQTGLYPGQRALIVHFVNTPGRKGVHFFNWPRERWHIKGACAPIHFSGPHQGYWLVRLEAREISEIPRAKRSIRKRLASWKWQANNRRLRRRARSARPRPEPPR